MRTPEQIAEDMLTTWTRAMADYGALGIVSTHKGSPHELLLRVIAEAIARECARAKLEAVEPNPGAELRSDGARHSDCTNCGGQSVTGGVFPPCEACGSTGDRVVQLEREVAALRALPSLAQQIRSDPKFAALASRVTDAALADSIKSFMMGDAPDAYRARQNAKFAMGPALDVRPRTNEVCSECGVAIEDMDRPEYCEAGGSIDPHADKVLHNWVVRCLACKAGHR